MEPQKIIFPQLHIKLGLIKDFVNDIDKNSTAFRNWHIMFQNRLEAKLEEEVFVSSQIGKLRQENDI